MLDLIGIFIASVIVSSTPLLLAASGELITEKAGVLNLGVEGMMLIGAITAFAVSLNFGTITLGVVLAAVFAALFSLLFAFLTQTLQCNQIASGLALTITGTGLSSLIGKDYIGKKIDHLEAVYIPLLRDIPVLGPAFFRLDAIAYFSLIMLAGIAWFLYRSKPGLILRSIGENHTAAYELGYKVIYWRYAAIAFGGAMCGIAGAYFSVVLTPHWAEEMTAGKGWIALALVVFAAWRPTRLIFGAYIFGGISLLQLHLQGAGVPVSPEFMSSLPYLTTIVVLSIISADRIRMRLNIPGCLGKPFLRSH